jgi:POT family proton-dependent oligopeptide transporter
MAGLIMGTWFFASAGGNFAAGLIAAATGAEGAGPERVTDVYTTVGWVAVAFGVFVILLSPVVRKLMHLDTLKDDDLAGYRELAENQAPGMRPDLETRPEQA